MKDFEVISKVVTIPNSDEKIFHFYSDFRNIFKMLPPEIEDFNADENSCSFKVKGQHISLKIVDKEEFKTIKITSEDNRPTDFNLWFQFKQLSAYETAARIVLRANLNPIMRNVLKKQLKEGLDKLADFMKINPYV